MKYALLLFAILLVSSVASAAFEVKELSLEYERYHPSGLLLQLPAGEKPKEGVAINTSLQLVGPLYWDFRIHGLTTNAQYRGVGLEFFFGLKPWRWISAGYRHHSQHCLDCHFENLKFASEDSLIFKFYLIGGNK